MYLKAPINFSKLNRHLSFIECGKRVFFFVRVVGGGGVEVGIAKYLFGSGVLCFKIWRFVFCFVFFCSRFSFYLTKCTVEHCSWDPQSFYLEKNIKNGSYGTIHTFKNYFGTMFLVFSFQQNKLYPNEP